MSPASAKKKLKRLLAKFPPRQFGRTGQLVARPRLALIKGVEITVTERFTIAGQIPLADDFDRKFTDQAISAANGNPKPDLPTFDGRGNHPSELII